MESHRGESWTINSVQLRALIRVFFILDLRSQHYEKATGSKAHELMTPLFWVTGQCLLAGAGISALLFARVDVFAFALGALMVSMLICGSAVVVEFNELVVGPDDLDVLGHRPISPGTYACARLINLLAYVLLVTIALNIFPAIVGSWLRDSGWRFSVGYAGAALLGNLLAAGGLIAVFTALSSSGPGEAVRDMLAWVQICIVLVFGYGIQAAFRDSHNTLEMLAWNMPSWVRSTPPGWLAGAAESFGFGEPDWWLLAGPAVLIVAVWAVAASALANAWTKMRPYRELRTTRVRSKGIPGELGTLLDRMLTVPGGERASFWLCSTMLRRDPSLRMQTWPLVASALGLLAVGAITGRLPNPFVAGGPGIALPIACVILPAMSMPSLLHCFLFSSQHRAAWLIETAPEGTRFRSISEGLRKAVMMRLIFPVFGFLYLAFWLRWHQPAHAAIHAGAGLMLADLTSRIILPKVVTATPLSQPTAKGEQLGQIGLITACVSGVVGAWGTLYGLACRSFWTLALLFAAALASGILANRRRGVTS